MPTYSDDLIKSILRTSRHIAMVGASGNENRPSYFAMWWEKKKPESFRVWRVQRQINTNSISPRDMKWPNFRKSTS